jgi:nicotinamide mononucleotide adenylyltransferase|tara:strand:- start:147 stop:545 length:399 start_codon:yes stop_codon:yes gene_type:complete
MKKYLAQAAFQSSFNENKYSMFIGRWQPWHPGHRWLIDQRLEEGKNVWIAIRNIPPDEKNPWTADEVMLNLANELHDLIKDGRVFISKVPDIESINIGRGVGYDVIEHCPPDEVRNISATKIRDQMKEDGKL